MKFATSVFIMVIANCIAEETTKHKLIQEDDTLAGAASQLYGRSLRYAGYQGAGFPYLNNLGFGFHDGISNYGRYKNGFRAPFRPSQLLSIGYDYPSYTSGGYGPAYYPYYGEFNSYGYTSQNSFGAYSPYTYSAYGSHGFQRPGYGGFQYAGSRYRTAGHGSRF